MVTQLKGIKKSFKSFVNNLLVINCLNTHFYKGNLVIKSHEVEMAMKQVDRKFYTPHNPYVDAPQGIGYGVTISAPHMVCKSQNIVQHSSHY